MAYNRRNGRYEDGLINRITDIEWEMYDRAGQSEGTGIGGAGEATYYAMRYSWFSFMPADVLESIGRDLDGAVENGRNPVMERQAYAIGYTAPESFREKLAPVLPAVSGEKEAAAEQIAGVLEDCEKQFEVAYPAITGRGKPVGDEGKDDRSYFISAAAELKTYSQATLDLLRSYLEGIDREDEDVNPAFVIHRTTVSFYGYTSLCEAEEDMF